MIDPLLFGRSKRNQELASGTAEANGPGDTHVLEGVKPVCPRKRDRRASAYAAVGPARPRADRTFYHVRRFAHCALSLITASGPGDLFTVRNVGNLVPAPDTVMKSGDTSVSAALDYCLHVLSIKHIVVCGHSGCGAMNAILSQGEHTNPETPLGAWLSHGNKSLEKFKSGVVMEGVRTDADALSQINVVEQLETLRSFPDVREREDAGTLQLVGLFFDIEEAAVHLYDASEKKFVPVNEDFDLDTLGK